MLKYFRIGGVILRVISGMAKGRKLKCPPGRAIRPTSDMVKESLFNIISADIYDSIFLDLFSGTGSIGIEALSRGANICYFVEKVYNNIKYINDNVKLLGSIDSAVILHMDALHALDYFNKNNIKFDFIYIDPPYYNNLYVEPLNKISEYELLNTDGYAIVEHHKNDFLEERYGSLQKFRMKKYGETILTFFKEATDEYSSISR